jgi:D-aminopeptidase
MATQNQGSYPSGTFGVPYGVIAIVQADAADLTEMVRGIYCNAAGDVKVGYHNGSSATHTVVAGQVLWGMIDRVYDTGTTLTNAQMIGYL